MYYNERWNVGIKIPKGSIKSFASLNEVCFSSFSHTFSVLQIRVKYISGGQTSCTFQSTSETRLIAHITSTVTVKTSFT